ncbi:MAG TPA: hypothetical protein VGK59_08600 [Ohtaekwangia sp.]
MKQFVIWVSLLGLAYPASGQFKKIRTQEVSDSITTVAVDRPGDLYIITKEGQLQHFDKDGKLYSLYKKDPSPTLFDPRDGSRLFAYFRPVQQYAYMSPSFEITQRIQLDSAFSIDPWLVCASGDYNVWILDAADWSLKKIDTKKGLVLTETVLPPAFSKLKSDYLTLREYQGFLFIADHSKGIHVFNSLGNHLRTISVPLPSYFNFLGEELYYQSGTSLIFFDLFSAETRELKLPETSIFSVLTDERLFLIKPRQIHIYEVK